MEESGKQGLKTDNQVVNQINYLLERFNNRLRLNNLQLSERYLNKELHILVHIAPVNGVFLTGQSGQIHTEFVAYLERAFPLNRLEIQSEGVNLSVTENALHAFLHEHPLQDHPLNASRESMNADCRTDCDDHAM